ncbi:unnamed protein product [Polarella glacialis]|uniref:Uncharacterized protein n=1 Tax=Polarella glacialis TaxID=89957 RepID=A0A813LTB0_POLGL|nr:unnamed protein product [Polarella glacialis]
MDARRLAEADACAFMVIDRWGDRLELSQEGSDCLTTMRAVVGSSQEAFLGCIRLRLIARLSKVLRLLDRLPGPGPVLVAAARAWVSLASKPPATDSTDLEAATGAVEELLQVRDAGQAEGAVSAAAAAAVDAESLITEVIHAAQHINSQCLPMPCKVLLSKVKEGLQQYASDTQGHDAEEPETIDVSSTATESQETPPEITAWQASQPSRPVTEQRPSAHHMHSPLLVREQGKILRRRRSSFGSDAARSRAPSFVGEEASEVESLHRGTGDSGSENLVPGGDGSPGGGRIPGPKTWFPEGGGSNITNFGARARSTTKKRDQDSGPENLVHGGEGTDITNFGARAGSTTKKRDQVDDPYCARLTPTPSSPPVAVPRLKEAPGNKSMHNCLVPSSQLKFFNVRQGATVATHNKGEMVRGNIAGSAFPSAEVNLPYDARPD